MGKASKLTRWERSPPRCWRCLQRAAPGSPRCSATKTNRPKGSVEGNRPRSKIAGQRLMKPGRWPSLQGELFEGALKRCSPTLYQPGERCPIVGNLSTGDPGVKCKTFGAILLWRERSRLEMIARGRRITRRGTNRRLSLLARSPDQEAFRTHPHTETGNTRAGSEIRPGEVA
jgi:hypothetical protein